MADSENLQAKTALVTGATQGIGYAIAEALARTGVRLTVAARREDKLQTVTQNLSAEDHPVRHQPMDLADTSSVDAACESLVKHSSSLDILILCGGSYEFSSWDGDPTNALRLALTTNVTGNARLLSQLHPVLRNAKGHVVFINSSIVNGTGAGNPAFAASQHALRSLADSFRAAVNDEGIRVTSIFPGRTATPRQNAIATHEGRSHDSDRLIAPRDVAATVIHCLTRPDVAEVTDVHLRQSNRASAE